MSNAQFTIEGTNEYGQWRRIGAAEPSPSTQFMTPPQNLSGNVFDTRDLAEAELPRLAEVFSCDVSELRVVELR